MNADDYTAIANLLAEYCLALDHDEIDRCIDLFTDDGAFEVYGRTWAGRDRLRKMMASAPRGLHLGGPPYVESIDGDAARSKQNLLFMERSGREVRRTLYTDDLRRTPEGWRIRRRRCQFITADGVRDSPGD